jgi:hypothetical protein
VKARAGAVVVKGARWRRTGRAAVALLVAMLALLGGGRAQAELLEVRQIAGGMECPECARGLRLLIKAIPGVDAAETSWNRRMLTVRFRRGNRATLGQVRAALVRQHFEAREAELLIAGRLTIDPAGRYWLRVTGSQQTYRIDVSGRTADWRRALDDLAGAEVLVNGRVPGAALAEDPLVLFPVSIERVGG